MGVYGKQLQRFDGILNGDGNKDSALYFDGHTVFVDLVGDAGQGSAAAFVVRGLDATTNAPTVLFRVNKDGSTTISVGPSSQVGDLSASYTSTASVSRYLTAVGNLASSYVSTASVSSYLTQVGNLASSYVSTASVSQYLTALGNLTASYISTASVSKYIVDSAAATATTNHDLVYSDAFPAVVVNILHKRRLQGYAAFKGDGSTDDSTVVNQAITDSSTKGWVEYPPGKTVCQQNVNLTSNVIVDLNDSIAKLVNSAASGAHVFRGTNFNTLASGNTTGGIYRFKLQNGRIDGNRSNNANGGHGVAVYGIGELDHLLIHDCHASAIWAEWSTTASELSALSLADGDQTFYMSKIHAYDCDLVTTVPGADYNTTPQGAGAGITGVTNTNNPTITTAQYHLLRAGQTITIANVLGSTGVNGTWTVLAVPSATTFTITTTSPGVFSTSASSTITTPVSAMVVVKGMDSPHLYDIELYQTLSVVPGSRGLLIDCSGAQIQVLHPYQNFATGVDFTGGNNTQVNGLYCGGHDQGILIRQNNVQISNWYVDSSFNNSIGLDYQSVGGGCHLLGGRLNGLTAGSYCVRLWNTSFVAMNAVGIGDGGSNTSTLYTAPNGTGGFHGFLYNGANGVNASPASLIVTT